MLAAESSAAAGSTALPPSAERSCQIDGERVEPHRKPAKAEQHAEDAQCG
jgi:hypothetical protein